MERTAVEAARRKFSPEFLNRLDKIVVFKPLGEADLRGVLDLELQSLNERLERAAGAASITLQASLAAQGFLLRQGTDARYGARHLKRTVEKCLVQPLSNLLATAQIQAGDAVRVDFDSAQGNLIFLKERKRTPDGAAVGSPRSAAA